MEEGNAEPELSEEELEQQKIEQDNASIEENYDNYVALDASEETKKLQEKELAKNKKKAVSCLVRHTYLIPYLALSVLLGDPFVGAPWPHLR